MPLIAANGTALHAVTLGDGPPVVMIHGLMLGSLAQWYFTAAPVLARTHRVVLYDLRGHGRSAREARGYDLATLADDLDGLLAALDVDGPIDVVGHSYGGLIALTWALRHPTRARRLVVADAPLPPGTALPLIGDGSPEAMLDALPAPVRDAVLHGGRRARRLLESLHFLARDTTLLADLVAEPGPRDAALARLPSPTAVVVGDRSACRAAGAHLAATLPDARLTVVPGGHFLPVEAPTALTDAIAAHLAA